MIFVLQVLYTQKAIRLHPTFSVPSNYLASESLQEDAKYHDLIFLEPIPLHGNDLRPFWVKAFPLLLLVCMSNT